MIELKSSISFALLVMFIIALIHFSVKTVLSFIRKSNDIVEQSDNRYERLMAIVFWIIAISILYEQFFSHK